MFALNDNAHVSKGAPWDSRHLKGIVTYIDVADVLATIPITERYLTLTVPIGSPAVEYWFRTGITDTDLIIKDAAAVLDQAPTEAFSANLTFNVYPSKDIQTYNLSGGNLTLTVAAAGNLRHGSIVLKVIADGVNSVNFGGPRWDANARYSIEDGEVLPAGTYWFYFLWDGTNAQVSVPGNIGTGGGGGSVAGSNWNFAANGGNFPVVAAGIRAIYVAEDDYGVEPGDPGGWVGAGTWMFSKNPAGSSTYADFYYK